MEEQHCLSYRNFAFTVWNGFNSDGMLIWHIWRVVVPIVLTAPLPPLATFLDIGLEWLYYQLFLNVENQGR